MKRSLLAGVAMAALSAPVARAAPSISIEVFDDGTLLSGNSSATGSDLLSVPNSADFSTIVVSADGIPDLPSPDLSSITLDASSVNSAVLEVLVTQTGVTLPTPSALYSTFTFNALNGQSETAVLSNYVDADNIPFALTTEIASANLSPSAVAFGPMRGPVVDSTLFSETEAYVITFDGADQSVSASSQISAPEPFSLTLLGSGLLGLGIVRRKRLI